MAEHIQDFPQSLFASTISQKSDVTDSFQNPISLIVHYNLITIMLITIVRFATKFEVVTKSNKIYSVKVEFE
jgi:hypothetical protein